MMKQKIKLSFRKFSDNSSMHGFNELFYANNIFWRIFWTLIIGLAISVTAYQVIKATQNFFDESTVTSVKPAKPNDITYPPLKICYPHWLYWANFSKANALGLSMNATLFGLSYLTDIFSMSEFDLTEAKEEFVNFYTAHNFKSLRSFFSIIMSKDPFRTGINFTSSEYEYFDGIIRYCDVLNEYGIRSAVAPTLDKNKKKRLTRKSTMLEFESVQPTFSALDGDFTAEELFNYINKWFHGPDWSANFSTKSFVDYSLPISVFPNGYDQDSFSVEYDRNFYKVKIQLSVHLYKSTNRVPCNSGWKWIDPNQTCELNCFRSATSQHLSHQLDYESAVFLERDDIDQTFGKTIFFPNKSIFNEQALNVSSIEDINVSLTQIDEDCNAQCNDVNGCQTYSFDSSVTASNKQSLPEKVSLIAIEYPTANEVLVMVEQESQTWEGFVGNVGGLLGIWTGASVVSFIQMFYLCCFAGEKT